MEDSTPGTSPTSYTCCNATTVSQRRIVRFRAGGISVGLGLGHETFFCTSDAFSGTEEVAFVCIIIFSHEGVQHPHSVSWNLLQTTTRRFRLDVSASGAPPPNQLCFRTETTFRPHSTVLSPIIPGGCNVIDSFHGTLFVFDGNWLITHEFPMDRTVNNIQLT